jgi:hypothetical protein
MDLINIKNESVNVNEVLLVDKSIEYLIEISIYNLRSISHVKKLRSRKYNLQGNLIDILITELLL